MKFYPERSQFMNNLIMTLIGFLVTMGFILRFSESILLKTWIPGTHNYEGVSTPMDS